MILRNKLRWGILGTGNAANVMARAINCSNFGVLKAVASRSSQSALNFAAIHDIDNYYDSYERLLEDKEVDVICIALPHNLHAEWSIKAAVAKKNILCEKPAAINFQSAIKVIEAVRRNDVFYMEGFMYRCHAQTKKLIELLRKGSIGKVLLIEASFCYHGNFDDQQYELKKITGGGGILDVGCYPISMARLIAATVNKVESIKPIQVFGMAHIGLKSESDDYSVAILKFEGDIFAQVSTGTALEHRNDVRIFGSGGSIYIPSPWVPGGSGPGETAIFLKKTGIKEIEEINIKTSIGLYEQEIDAVSLAILNGRSGEVSLQDTLDNMDTIQLWRNSINIKRTDDSVDFPSVS